MADKEPIKRDQPLPTFKAAKYYDVKLYKAAQYARRTFTPHDKLKLRGDVAQQIVDAIWTAQEVEDE